jgi:polar amino acid transport system substrate-binding protein
VNPKAVAALVGVAVLGLSACGSNSLSSGPGAASPSAGSSASAPVAVDDALVAKLPAKIKDAGAITVGTDASYAPNEFLDADGKTVVGMDVDLFSAVAAKFGVTAKFQPADFSSIITGVQGGKYDVGVSSFTINADRKKQVTMVSYFNAGTQWASLKDNPKKVDPGSPCGKTIAVQTGTVQETDDLPARQAKCGSDKINILTFKGQDQATNAVITGRADAMLADSPVTAYAVKQTGGKLAALGDVYDSAPYGYVLPKNETDFGGAVATALQDLQKDGTYARILAKWGVDNGATTTFAVNP